MTHIFCSKSQDLNAVDRIFKRHLNGCDLGGFDRSPENFKRNLNTGQWLERETVRNLIRSPKNTQRNKGRKASDSTVSSKSD